MEDPGFVTWVENMGLSEITRGGMGFGATLMQDLLERSCERRRYSTEQESVHSTLSSVTAASTSNCAVNAFT
ncbi:hypothetical protein Tco_0229897, partial [Tanacetum coccineum]